MWVSLARLCCRDREKGCAGRGVVGRAAQGALRSWGLDQGVDASHGVGAQHGRPTDTYAGFCGRLRLDWYFCQPADPQAKGAVERLQGYMESNFEPGRHFANHLDFQLQLDVWFQKANARTHKTLRARPVDRLTEEQNDARTSRA